MLITFQLFKLTVCFPEQNYVEVVKPADSPFPAPLEEGLPYDIYSKFMVPIPTVEEEIKEKVTFLTKTILVEHVNSWPKSTSSHCIYLVSPQKWCSGSTHSHGEYARPLFCGIISINHYFKVLFWSFVMSHTPLCMSLGVSHTSYNAIAALEGSDVQSECSELSLALE